MSRACIRCRTKGVDEDDNHGLCADCIYEEEEALSRQPRVADGVLEGNAGAVADG